VKRCIPKDGISKTWSEVAVHADVLLNKNKNGRQRSVPLVFTTHFTEIESIIKKRKPR
jgi:replicative DNA helicase